MKETISIARLDLSSELRHALHDYFEFIDQRCELIGR